MTTPTQRLRPYPLVITAVIIACAPRAPAAPSPEPGTAAPPVEWAPLPAPNPSLPPVPLVEGPLEIRIVYPPADHLIASRDSNFIFGSVGNGRAGLAINGILVPVWPNGAFMGWVPNPPPEAPRYELVATTGFDSARVSHPVRVQPRDTIAATVARDTLAPLSPPQYAALVGSSLYPSDTDRVVTAYRLEGGAHRWFLLPETVVEVAGYRSIGQTGATAQVQLDSQQTVLMERQDLNLLPADYAPAARVAGAASLSFDSEWADLVIPLSARPAHLIEQGANTLTLVLYGTSGESQRSIQVPGGGSAFVRSASAMRDGPQMRYQIVLGQPVFGYQVLWQDSALALRVRRMPAVDAAAPLRGLTIAVDPGHPPGGATGPTALREPVAVLDVGLRLRELLQEQGATVLMTRTGDDTVALNLRPTMARRADAHALVSIHLDALPDGANPFLLNGTTTYHYHVNSRALGEAVQRRMLTQLGLRDKGVIQRNLALVRPTWMPAILTEGAFIMMPDQEAALRTAEYRERYARAIAEGLESYFLALAEIQR